MIHAGEKVKVFFQTPDGSMMELTGLVDEIEVSYGRDFLDITSFGDSSMKYLPCEPISMTVKMQGSGPMFETFGIESTKKYLQDKREKFTKEWACDWCGRPNEKERTTCKGCGGVRSFIYD